MKKDEDDLKLEKKKIIYEILQYCGQFSSKKYDVLPNELASHIVKTYKNVDDLINDFINPFEHFIFKNAYKKALLIDYFAFEEVYKQFLKEGLNEENKNSDIQEKFKIFLSKTYEFSESVSENIRGKEGLIFYTALKNAFKDYPEILDIIKKAEKKEIERLARTNQENIIALENVVNLLESKLSNE